MSAEGVKFESRPILSAEGARIEAPKALSGLGSGEGCPLPSRLGDLGERRKLPQRGPGRSPGRQRVLPSFRVKKTFLDSKMHFKKYIFMCLCSRGSVFGTINYITIASL